MVGGAVVPVELPAVRIITEFEVTFTLLNVCVVKDMVAEPYQPTFAPDPVATLIGEGATL
tara:strand:- start:13 stop:192 length:180 start_codon:yes stop_codon:yes gene_type:complete